MAASVAGAPPSRQDRIQEPVWRYKVEWTSDAAGAASGDIGHVISGAIASVVTVPSTTAAPTASYDITLTDDYGFDLLAGGGADRHTSNKERINPTAIQYHGNLTLNVTNAGDTKSGIVYIYVR